MQAAKGGSHGVHDRDRMIVDLRSAGFTNLLIGSVGKRLVNIASITEVMRVVLLTKRLCVMRRSMMTEIGPVASARHASIWMSPRSLD